MPRPITKADIKRWRHTHSYNFRVKETHATLGIIIKFFYVSEWAYSVDSWGRPIFVDKRTINLRKRIGHPKPRRKRHERPILPDTMFSLDEMDLACSIMEELS